MTLLSIFKNYSSADWQTFLLTGAGVIIGIVILYFAYFRKVEKRNRSEEGTSEE